MPLTDEQLELLQKIAFNAVWDKFKNTRERHSRRLIGNGCRDIMAAMRDRREYMAQMTSTGDWATIADEYNTLLGLELPLMQDDGVTPHTLLSITEALEAEFEAWFAKVQAAQNAAAEVGFTLFTGLPEA